MPRLSKLAAIASLLVLYPLVADEPDGYSELLSSYLSGISTLSGSFEQHTSNQNARAGPAENQHGFVTISHENAFVIFGS